MVLTMKKPHLAHISQNELDGLDAIPEFNGYFVDRFNDVYSYRAHKRHLKVPQRQRCGSGNVSLRLCLYDNNGKRRVISRRKVLISALGKSEFESREELRQNKTEILKAEAEAKAEEQKRRQEQAKAEHEQWEAEQKEKETERRVSEEREKFEALLAKERQKSHKHKTCLGELY